MPLHITKLAKGISASIASQLYYTMTGTLHYLKRFYGSGPGKNQQYLGSSS